MFRHPKYGILGPSAFLPGADVDTLCALTERAIIHGLRDWQAFAEIGIRLKLAINVPVTALTTLAIPALVREHRPADPKWPGLILEVTEDEIIRDIALANEVATRFACTTSVSRSTISAPAIRRCHGCGKCRSAS